ncbi:MAG: oxidoreductase [Phycisphaerales bacterium]|nr:oxidoreductase [Phycisphaerales bacterium]MCB9858588.1 oxidoreductase [Phycisphaerales bacterium]
MSELHLPWLEAMVVLPLLGAVVIRLTRHSDAAWRRGVVFSGLTLLAAIGAWQEFNFLHVPEAHSRFDVLSRVFQSDVLFIDELSAPLLPLTALLYLLVILATMRTKIRHFSISRALCSEAIVLATFLCHSAWGVIGCLIAGTIPLWFELRRRGQPTRIFVIHMGVFSILLVAGQSLVQSTDPGSVMSVVGICLLTIAALTRSGIVPAHCWISDLFERASFGMSLLFVTPLVGAFAVMRLVLPIAPTWILEVIAIASLITAVYAAGMALVQRDTRRFFCYLFLSHASLVLIGIELTTPIGMTGALCTWIAVGLSLTGLGLTLRSVEARTGRLPLDRFHGLYDHVPALAALFLLTGLASIGFPGTLGFVGAELLVEGTVRASPAISTVVVITGALNGLAIMRVYFRIFTGTRHVTSIDISSRSRERLAVTILALLIIGGGLFPQPGVESRYHAAVQLAELRQQRGLGIQQAPNKNGLENAANVTTHGPRRIDAPRRHSARPEHKS